MLVLRLPTSTVAARKRDNILGAENLFLPLDANVCLVPRKERPGHVVGVIAVVAFFSWSNLSTGSGVVVDGPPKHLSGARRGGCMIGQDKVNQSDIGPEVAGGREYLSLCHLFLKTKRDNTPISSVAHGLVNERCWQRHNSNKQRTSPKWFTSIVSLDTKFGDGEASLALLIQLVFEINTQTGGSTGVERYAAAVQPNIITQQLQ